MKSGTFSEINSSIHQLPLAALEQSGRWNGQVQRLTRLELQEAAAAAHAALTGDESPPRAFHMVRVARSQVEKHWALA
mgnify:CR=1 FL=1